MSGYRRGSLGEGFGYVPGGHGRAHRKIPQVGRCLIGDDVEIGANTTVDRGSVDDTVVGAGTKIDNLVQIAHNVHVGERCLIAAMAGIAGSTHVGDEVFLGGQVGIADHVVGGRDLLELLLGLFVAWIEIRVQLFRQLTIGLADLVLRRLRLHAQDSVGILAHVALLA